MPTGQEWIVDAFDCSPPLLATPDAVRRLCEAVIEELGLNVVGEPLWHQFSPGGVTGLYLLSESHLACHTWPESGTATFNLFCCRPRPRFAWRSHLIEGLQAARVSVRRVRRGLPEVVDSTTENSPSTRGKESP